MNFNIPTTVFDLVPREDIEATIRTLEFTQEALRPTMEQTWGHERIAADIFMDIVGGLIEMQVALLEEGDKEQDNIAFEQIVKNSEEPKEKGSE